MSTPVTWSVQINIAHAAEPCRWIFLDGAHDVDFYTAEEARVQAAERHGEGRVRTRSNWPGKAKGVWP